VAAFNPTYLSDGLSAASGDRVVVEVRDGLKPALVRGEGQQFVYLVMPMKLPAPVG
jgi:DNA polymerase-3 subunit beta